MGELTGVNDLCDRGVGVTGQGAKTKQAEQAEKGVGVDGRVIDRGVGLAQRETLGVGTTLGALVYTMYQPVLSRNGGRRKN
jgi:hypothetical protein